MGPVDVDDNAAFIMRFASGAYGFIEATHFSAGRKNSFGFELHGEKGTLYFDWLRMNELQYYNREDPIDREGFRTIVMGPMHPYGEAFWPVQGYGTWLYRDQDPSAQRFHRGHRHGPQAADGLP